MDTELLGCIEEEEETGTDFIIKDVFIVVYCCKCKTHAFGSFSVLYNYWDRFPSVIIRLHRVSSKPNPRPLLLTLQLARQYNYILNYFSHCILRTISINVILKLLKKRKTSFRVVKSLRLFLRQYSIFVV